VPQLLLLLLLLVLVAAAAAAVVIVVVACACVRVLCVCACVRVRVRVRVCVCVYVSVSNGTPVIAASGDTGGGMKAALQKFSGCADPDTTAMGLGRRHLCFRDDDGATLDLRRRSCRSGCCPRLGLEES
jgi:hypothetical protein